MPSHKKPSDPVTLGLTWRGALLCVLLATAICSVLIIAYMEVVESQVYTSYRTRYHQANALLAADQSLRNQFRGAEMAALRYAVTGDAANREDYRAAKNKVVGILGNRAILSEQAQTPINPNVPIEICARFSDLDKAVGLGPSSRFKSIVRPVDGLGNSRDVDAVLDRMVDEQSTTCQLIGRKTDGVYHTETVLRLLVAGLRTLVLIVAIVITIRQRALRKRAEAVAHKEADTLRRLTEILHATTDFVGMADVRGHVLFHNRAFRAFLGQALDDDHPDDFIHTTHAPWSLDVMVNEALPTAVRDGIWQGESGFLRHDGIEVPVSQVVIAHRNAEGVVTQLSTLARDISQHKKAEAEMLEKQRFVEQIVQASPNLVYLHDIELNRKVYCSGRAMEMLGFSAAEIAGDDNIYAQLIDTDDTHLVELQLLHMLEAADDELNTVEYRIKRADGLWRWICCRETVFKRNSDGRPTQIIGVAEDVTDARNAAEEMLTERARLQAVIEAKRQIINAGANRDAVLRLVCEHAQTITRSDSAAVQLRDEDEFVHAYAFGSMSDQIGMRMPYAHSLSGWCVENREAAVCIDTEDDCRVNTEAARRLNVRSMLIVPLFSDDDLIGVLTVASAHRGAFSGADLDALVLVSDFFAMAVAGANEAEYRTRLLEERTEALVAVRENEAMLRLTFEAMQEGLIVQRTGGTVELFNPAAARILDMREGELLGTNESQGRFSFIHEDGSDMTNDERPSRVAFLTGMPRRDVVMGVKRPASDPVWLFVDAIPLIDPETHKVLRVVTTFSDITSRRASEKQLEALATTDGLTGIRNHRAFHERLTLEISRAVRYNHGLALIMVDVDHFKSFNDAFGHPAGDSVLKIVAGILERHARTTDMAARYGGEEFAIILPETDTLSATVLAERIRAAIEQTEWEHRPITASMGVAFFSLDLTDPSNFVARADRALYRAKAQGRNQVCVSRRGISPPTTTLSASR